MRLSPHRVHVPKLMVQVRQLRVLSVPILAQSHRLAEKVNGACQLLPFYKQGTEKRVRLRELQPVWSKRLANHINARLVGFLRRDVVVAQLLNATQLHQLETNKR
ncbi:hypothetical protein TraAM80_06122 [Trypanosoma rangeli]|uniref:Uncharacterized protein n=1 Tax=Trypanosoma rangeli TaxID=5698 RepID=A0A3R7LT48_TRYRA|nr:uncharacterized protein TraAM80_06122 [Trypanosoma rangeli]RNF02829.1 hypothetical protein TraAM80_06122 [Trypanosoma rangeli]|eukprot:RNF02829.1 hypothetical protein TraAM80_06122 [Trypanosoma rangeli]